MTQLDADHDKKINYTEFLAATIDINQMATKQRLSSIFKQLDSDGDGQITEDNIKTAFSKFGIEVDDETVKGIINMHDKDGDN